MMVFGLWHCDIQRTASCEFMQRKELTIYDPGTADPAGSVCMYVYTCIACKHMADSYSLTSQMCVQHLLHCVCTVCLLDNRPYQVANGVYLSAGNTRSN
jgi:hypothetical protein